MYTCMQCVRSNTRAQALRGSIVASPHASSVLQNARPRSDAALQMARPHHLCCPPGHGASAAAAAASSQIMASPRRCTQDQRICCTISLSSSCNGSWIKRMNPSDETMLWAATSFPVAPRAYYSLLQFVGGREERVPPAPTPCIPSFLAPYHCYKGTSPPYEKKEKKLTFHCGPTKPFFESSRDSVKNVVFTYEAFLLLLKVIQTACIEALHPLL